MRSIHQFTEQLYIVFLQRFHRPDSPLVFIYRMSGTAHSHLIFDGGFVLFKLLLAQIPEPFDIHNFLQFRKRRLTLASSLIICGIDKAVLHFAVCHNNLCPLQHKRRILIGQICRIQKDRIVFLTHSGSKLIHNTAVHTVIIVLGILPDQREVHVCHIKAIQIPQDITCQHFEGRGGR